MRSEENVNEQAAGHDEDLLKRLEAERAVETTTDFLQKKLVRLALTCYVGTYMLACASDQCEESQRLMSDSRRELLSDSVRKGQYMLQHLPFELEALGVEVSVNHQQMKKAAVGIARARLRQEFEEAELLEANAVKEALSHQPNVCVLIGRFEAAPSSPAVVAAGHALAA